MGHYAALSRLPIPIRLTEYTFGCPDDREELRIGSDGFSLLCSHCGGEYLHPDESMFESVQEWNSFDQIETGGVNRVGVTTEKTEALSTLVSGTSALASKANKISSKVSKIPNFNGMRRISHVCDSMHLPNSVVQSAKKLYETFSSQRNTRSESALVAACIVKTCRDLGETVRPLRDVLSYIAHKSDKKVIVFFGEI